MSSRLRIIVTGLIAQHPFTGGIAWHHFQYVLGLARLGHDVYYFEDSGEYPYTLDGGPSGNDWVAPDCTYNVDYLGKLMQRFGLAGKWAYRFPTKAQWFGLSDADRRTVVESADLLINISGTLEYPGQYRRIPRLVYIDTDPVFTQIRLAQRQPLRLMRANAHDMHFTFGERLADPIPVTGHQWHPTRQPIVLSEWRPSRPRRDVFTTIMNWTSYESITHDGEAYAQKDVEFRRFLELPSRVDVELEIALSTTEHVEWETDDGGLPPTVRKLDPYRERWTPRDLLAATGWRVVSPLEACADFDSYRNYIETSKAEFSVAKNAYVKGRPGWFSERSACYLAAGRPVVTEDTGFGPVLPVGEGILSFTTMDEAAAGVEEVERNYKHHAKAARNIAEEYFDSDKILPRLIEETFAGPSLPAVVSEPFVCPQ